MRGGRNVVAAIAPRVVPVLSTLALLDKNRASGRIISHACFFHTPQVSGVDNVHE